MAQASPEKTAAPGPSRLLNAKKLSERIGSLVEQPPFVSGGGGYAATDRDSFAHARAQLVLVAFQAYPVLVRKFPQLRIWSLLESHPQDGTTGVADSANVRVRPVNATQGREGLEVSLAGGVAPPTEQALASLAGGGSGAEAAASGAAPEQQLVTLRVDIPCRSSATGKVLGIGDIRRYMWRALILGAATKAGLSESQVAEEVEALEGEYRARYFDHAPQDVAHLVLMGVLAERYVEEYAAFVTAVVQPREEKNGIQRGLSDVHGVNRTEHRSSAVGLWWPVREGAITFAEMQHQKALLAAAQEAARVAEAEELRLKRLAAAEKRLSGGGAGGK